MFLLLALFTAFVAIDTIDILFSCCHYLMLSLLLTRLAAASIASFHLLPLIHFVAIAALLSGGGILFFLLSLLIRLAQWILIATLGANLLLFCVSAASAL